MTYDEIAAIFLTPTDQPFPPLVPPSASPARRLRDAVEPIATQGWWSRPAGDRITGLGLPFLPGYVWGRAAALGEPAASVVVAAFGVFEPGMLTGAYDAGRSFVGRDDVLAERAEGAAEALDSLVTADEADAVAEPLMQAVGGLDGLGRPLFGALRELPQPPTPGGRLWRATELVREHRGDGHLAAVVTTGLDAVEANVLTELWLGYGFGEYSGTRAFGPDALAAAVERLGARGWVESDGSTPTLTAGGRAARVALEEATDLSQAALVDALGPDIDEIVERAAAISERIVTAGWFPHDPRKRAGG
ncbi:hypothetical protein BH23ACT3_BH23ACT3_17630 [soil metagenome]